MSGNDTVKLCNLRIKLSSAKTRLNRSVLGPDTRTGLIWFEPAPGTRSDEQKSGFHPLLRDAGCDLPDIDLLELRHFRPDGVTIWQAGDNIVRFSVIDEVTECPEDKASDYCKNVHRVEKTVLPHQSKRFTGRLDAAPDTKFMLIEYWLSGRRIAWTITKQEGSK